MLARMAREWSVFMRQPVLPRYSKHPRSLLRHLTLLRALLLAAAVFVCWGYTQLLVRYGSISPAATALFTTSYDGRAAFLRPLRPGGRPSAWWYRSPRRPAAWTRSWTACGR